MGTGLLMNGDTNNDLFTNQRAYCQKYFHETFQFQREFLFMEDTVALVK